MRFKIKSNWGDKLVSEQGQEIGEFNVILALDLSTNKSVYLVSRKNNEREQGGSYESTSIDVICTLTDKKLNEWSLEDNKYQAGYILDIATNEDEK